MPRPCGLGEKSMGMGEEVRAMGAMGSKPSNTGSSAGEGGAEVIDMVDAKETSKSDERKSSVSSRVEGVCRGELGWDWEKLKCVARGEEEVA